MNIGAIVFDTNAIKILEDEHVRSCVIASLWVVDLGVRLSAVNVLELAKTENVRVRNRLLGVADALSSDRWILPLPACFFGSGQKDASIRGTGFVPPASGMEWLVLMGLLPVANAFNRGCQTIAFVRAERFGAQ